MCVCVGGGGLCLFKGLRLLFLSNVAEARIIQGVISIPDSRVADCCKYIYGCIGTFI